jgi:predicted enzyme related to lactoylglutathione lyase
MKLFRSRKKPEPKPGDPLFKRLAYIYIGTKDYAADYAFYKNVLNAQLVWEFNRFGAKVAAFSLSGEPYLLLADHVKEPCKRLIYEVDNLKDAAKILTARGWKADSKKFGIPDGYCLNFNDPSGNEYAIAEMSRPRLLEQVYRPK